MEDDVTPLVGFMVDPNAAQIVFVALTKLVSALDCGGTCGTWMPEPATRSASARWR